MSSRLIRMQKSLDMKFREIVPYWVRHKEKMVKKSTMATYLNTTRNHILPAFGDWEVKEMTKKRIRPVLLSIMETKNLSRKTVADQLIVLKMILDFAASELEWEDVPNMRWKMEWPTHAGNGTVRLERYNSGQLSRLVSHCEINPSFRNLGILLVCCTGLRIGEVCGLRWEDIDIQNKCLTVRRTLERIYCQAPDKENKGKSMLIFSDPKTSSSRRTVPIMANIFTLVRDFSHVARPDYYLLTGSPKPMEPRALRTYYKAVLDELGLPYIKFHGLRHTFASSLVESGVDVKTVSSLLGHSDVSTTLNLYCHPTDEGKAKAIASGLSKVFTKRNRKHKPWEES